MFHTHFPGNPHLDGWFADLCDPVSGCPYSANNIGRCDLFPPAGSQPANAEIATLTARLPARGTAPIPNNWRAASNGAAGAPAVCVALGPPAPSSPPDLVRTQTVDGLFKLYRNQFTGLPSSADLELLAATDPAGADAIRPLLGPGARVRGIVRSAFWADKAAIDSFRQVNPTAAGLRRYHGVEDGGTGPGAVVVVELRDQTLPTPYPRLLPTGYDAANNPYFLPQPVGSAVGVTQNIVPAGQPGFRHPETPEVVTPEVDYAHTRFEAALVR